MKGRYLFFAACLGCLVFLGAHGADDTTNVRAAVRRTSGNTATAPNQTHQKKSPTETTARPITASGRSVTSEQGRTIGARATSVSNSGRTNTNIAQRASKNTSVKSRTTPERNANITRTATQSRTAATTPQTAQRTTIPTQKRQTITASARAATTNELRDAIMGRNYKSCRQVYYECMDEFCANKDTQLKRCACSTRLHEFDRAKKQLSDVEDKLLDFNQRLLTVNMDKEDAAALFTATEGELAFNKKDTSASKKILDEISKKLNSNKDDHFNQNLTAISLSLDTDAAFDTVDSLMGASTTIKEGIELYNAALPVCREMAAEICDAEALAIAESGYQMTIEQDCNTVSKTYETQTNQAREKIREAGALLDISRLDIYQKRNSDDVLTCKKKMLNQLYDTSVCGDNLEHCLDISGQYIDPTTGQAFLTQNLANLSTLITRPSNNQTWTNAPGNDRFVSYLNSKKKYLEPAMENCQEIADLVWTDFIDDALAQIKLAQDKKLEEVRQSCTTLTTQCLSNASKSISDFDARALSTFGVMADKTANDMCANVRNACTALLETAGGADDWIGGMSQIATEKTYDTIMQTCREVGRACIIQACKSISGNFGMCENIQNSINRKAIINRTSCWKEVNQCVAEAGTDTINRIFDNASTNAADNGGTFYNELYGIEFNNFKFYNSASNCHQTSNTNCIYDICATECGCKYNNQEPSYTCDALTSIECRVCRLSEKIWGNCEAAPTANIESKEAHNKILIPKDPNTTTLLSWFAQNTGTTNNIDSCRDTSCPSGYHAMLYDTDNNNITCVSSDNFLANGYYCPNKEKIFKANDTENCCRTSEKALMTGTDGAVQNNNCCIGAWAKTSNPMYGTASNFDICHNKNYTVVANGITWNNTTVSLVCISDSAPNGTAQTTAYPNGKTIKCDGHYVYVDADGHHYDPMGQKSYMSYVNSKGQPCTDKYWGTTDCDTPDAWMINIPD